MNETIVSKWNERVREEDMVYFLGDLCLPSRDYAKWLKQLKGNIVWIKGNHDSDKAPVKTELTMTIEGHVIVMYHYPIKVWDRKHYGSWHLYGHSHGTMKELNGLSLDVGVDKWDFYPVNLNSVIVHMNWLRRSHSNKELGLLEEVPMP